MEHSTDELQAQGQQSCWGKVTLEWCLKQRMTKELPKPMDTESAAPGGTTALCAGTELLQFALNLKHHPLHTQPLCIKQNISRRYFTTFLSGLVILCFLTTSCGRGYISVTEHDAVALASRVSAHKTSCKLN